MTAAADLLLTLINQIPPVPSPPPPPPSLFNFSYIDVTSPRTTTDPSTDSDTIIPSSSTLSLTTIPCDDYGTVTLSIPYDDFGIAILPTTSLERIISYSLLSLYLLIPSQFIRLSYGDYHYFTVSISKQRPATLSSSTPRNVTKTSTPPLQDTPSRSISSDDSNIYLSYFFSSLVDIVLMMILIMTILPTVIIILFIILLMMFVMLPAVISTRKEQDVFPDEKTMNIDRSPTSLITILLTASPSLYKKSGKKDKLCLQRRQF